jgi:predicted nuclease of predicted toxin-antitoxin system
LKIKIDENLPLESADVFRVAGFDAHTVGDESLSGVDDPLLAEHARSEGRVLVTLDLGFANVQTYDPGIHAGIIVLRLKRQDKHTILGLMHRVALALANREPDGELWIVELDRIRFRSS